MESKYLQGVNGVAYCTRVKRYSAIASALLLGLISGTKSSAASIELQPCQLEHPARLMVAAAECGTLEVLENPAAPNGRRIPLRIARVPAINRRKAPDPVFLLAGGPGGSAISMYA